MSGVVQSFMAAVQLGLKRRFGGKVDHLRMVLQDEPGKDGGPRKHFVMLYDWSLEARAICINCLRMMPALSATCYVWLWRP